MSKPLSQTTLTLIKAKEVLERDGWIKGSYSSNRGYCAVGAVINVDGVTVFDTDILPPLNALLRQINTESKDPVFTVTDWNDRDDRTKEEVLAVFDRAIAASMEEVT
jgi:hypothetical protein